MGPDYYPCDVCATTGESCNRWTCDASAESIFYVMIPIAIAFPVLMCIFCAWYRRCGRRDPDATYTLDNGLRKGGLQTKSLKPSLYEEMYNSQPQDAGFRDLHDAMKRKYSRKTDGAVRL